MSAGRQLELFGPGAAAPAAPRTATPIEGWAGRLARGRDVRVVFTENRVVLASLGGSREAPRLRVHRIFAEAPEPVAEAVARLYLAPPRRGLRHEMQTRLRDFIRRHDGASPAAAPPRATPPRGTAHDLRPLLARVSGRWFDGRLEVVVGWSMRPARRTLARWYEVTGDRSRILVNRLLDAADVPERVLEYLLYHEALHEVLRDRRCKGRRVYHHPEFHRRERLFPSHVAVGTEAERLLERLWRRHRQAGRARAT